MTDQGRPLPLILQFTNILSRCRDNESHPDIRAFLEENKSDVIFLGRAQTLMKARKLLRKSRGEEGSD